MYATKSLLMTNGDRFCCSHPMIILDVSKEVEQQTYDLLTTADRVICVGLNDPQDASELCKVADSMAEYLAIARCQVPPPVLVSTCWLESEKKVQVVM